MTGRRMIKRALSADFGAGCNAGPEKTDKRASGSLNLALRGPDSYAVSIRPMAAGVTTSAARLAPAERLAAARQGDRSALGELLGELRRPLLRYCTARLGHPQTAEDVTQEVLVAVVEALPRFRGDSGGVVAFAFGIAANKVADSRRAAGRRRAVLRAEVPEQADPADGPEESALRSADVRRARALLQELPEAQREILLLRMSGLSADEVGAVVGMTAGAVRVAAHRGLQRLRSLAGQPA